MCEDRQDINNSFESDNQEAHVSNNVPVEEMMLVMMFRTKGYLTILLVMKVMVWT